MDGIIIVNKEKGYTSNDVVQIVKKIYNEKVGHTGTLDPMATGVLPLLIGKGTSLSKYLINHDKVYEATIKLGIATNTGDLEGKIIEEKEVDKNILKQENIEKVLKEFLGKQTQIPPIYSAIKVKGKKLYEYARNGEEVEIPSREITIYNINLINIDKKENEIKFNVSCSKGTYIRTLCKDIAKKIGTIGYMSNLNRIKVGDFDIKNSITIDELKQNENIKIITIEEFFKNNNKIDINNNNLKLLLNGVKIKTDLDDGIYKIYNNNIFIGIATVKNKILKRDIIV